MPVTSGVYRIQNCVNGSRYVGSSKRVEMRIEQHRKALNNRTHYNSHLQAAWDLYGEDEFGFTLIEECEPECVKEREQFWIDTLMPEYNMSKLATGNSGPTSEETKMKLSIANKGKQIGKGRSLSPEHKAAIGAANRGIKRTLEERAAISAGMIGKRHSDERRAANSAAQRGKKLSPEHHAALMAGLKAARERRKSEKDMLE